MSASTIGSFVGEHARLTTACRRRRPMESRAAAAEAATLIAVHPGRRANYRNAITAPNAFELVNRPVLDALADAGWILARYALCCGNQIARAGTVNDNRKSLLPTINRICRSPNAAKRTASHGPVLMWPEIVRAGFRPGEGRLSLCRLSAGAAMFTQTVASVNSITVRRKSTICSSRWSLFTIGL